MKLAVIGSQSRIGVTHFALGMSISCQKAGNACLYEEQNDSQAILDLYRNADGAKERNGVYYFSGFAAVPKYGQAVLDEVHEQRTLVRDYGAYQEAHENEYDACDCIIVIAGGKEWELRQTKDLAERYRQRKNVYFVLRTSSFMQFQRLVKTLGLTRAWRMPLYENPFLLKRKVFGFYRKLLAHIRREHMRIVNSRGKKK